MPALPTVGASEGTWGTELNEFLEISHGPAGLLDVGSNADGALTVNDTGTILGPGVEHQPDDGQPVICRQPALGWRRPRTRLP